MTDGPPASVEAAYASERVVAGSCLLGAEHVEAAAAALDADDFGHHATQLVFATARKLADAGKPVAADTVFAELARQGKGADVGGAGFLAELLGEAGVGANLEYHAGQVRNAALVRRLRHLATEMIAATRSPEQPAEEVLAEFEQKLFDLGRGLRDRGAGLVDAAACLEEAKLRIDDRQTEGAAAPRGVRTGFADLDDLLNGLRPGSLTVLAARPGVGKSALAASFLLHAAFAGVSGLFVSLEMSREEIGDRFLAMLAGVDLKRIGGADRLSQTEAEKVIAVTIDKRARIWIDDRAGQTAARIGSTVRRAVRRHGVGLVVVDYLQLVHPENTRDRHDLQVGKVATRLKELAKMARVPVVALAQLNREVESRADGKPKLSDLRDSGQIEQDADNVLMLHPQDAKAGWQFQDVDLLVEKNRQGPRGIVRLTYRRPFVRFEARTVEHR